MPRQSSAAAAFSTGTPAGTRPMIVPPADLDELERAEFATIVLGAPPKHFLPSDAALIGCYAKAIVLERIAFGELRAAGYVIDGRPSGWLPVWKESQRAVTTYARMLSLSPAGRVPSQAEPQAVSYYERMNLEHRDGQQN